MHLLSPPHRERGICIVYAVLWAVDPHLLHREDGKLTLSQNGSCMPALQTAILREVREVHA